jgi:hypothetical protein
MLLELANILPDGRTGERERRIGDMRTRTSCRGDRLCLAGRVVHLRVNVTRAVGDTGLLVDPQSMVGWGHSSEDELGDESLECEGDGGNEQGDGYGCAGTTTCVRRNIRHFD